MVFTNDKGAWTLYDAPAGKYSIKSFDSKGLGESNSVTFEVDQKGVLDRLIGTEKLQEAPALIAR